MPSPAIVVLVGNPRPGSRTAGVARRLARAIAGPAGPEIATIDLAELTESAGPPLGADVAGRYATPLAQLHAARLLVVATPVYKGSYTGLLKSFLDQVNAGALQGITAVPVLTVGSPAHSLAAEVHLRPLLVELGASTPTASLIVTADVLDQPDRLDAAITAWLDRNQAFVTLAPGDADLARAQA